MTLPPDTIRKLNAPLDMRRVQKRQGAGGRSLDYMASHDVIRTANAVFDYGQWGTETTTLVCIGEQTFEKDGKKGWRVGYRATVRLTVMGCVPTDGSGYGDAMEYGDSPITAHELAMKEAESDAEKRAFRKFGDQFGLILWAKPAERPAIERVARIRAERAADGGAPASPAPAAEPSAGEPSAVDTEEPHSPPSVSEAAPSEPPSPADTPEEGPTAPSSGPIVKPHAVPWLLTPAMLEETIDALGGPERAELVALRWDAKPDAATLKNVIGGIRDVDMLVFCADHEARGKARVGLLNALHKQLVGLGWRSAPLDDDPAGAPDLPRADSAVTGSRDGYEASAPVGSSPALDAARAAAAAAGHPQIADVAEVLPEPLQPASPLVRLRAVMGYVAEHPSAVLVPSMWTESGILNGLRQTGSPLYVSLEDVPDEELAFVWLTVPADVRAHLEGLPADELEAMAS